MVENRVEGVGDQRGLAATGNAGYAYQRGKRKIDGNILQVVASGPDNGQFLSIAPRVPTSNSPSSTLRFLRNPKKK